MIDAVLMMYQSLTLQCSLSLLSKKSFLGVYCYGASKGIILVYHLCSDHEQLNFLCT